MRIFCLYIILNFFQLPNLTAQEKRFLTFYATREGNVGHAFVSFVREDNNLQMTVVDGCWGFYPQNSYAGGASFFIGSVPGQIRNDFQTQKDIGLTVEVSKSEYEGALKIKQKWESASYKLTVQDCVSFTMEVAQSLNGKINLPKRSTFDRPHSYIEELKLLNDSANLCPAHPDIVTEYSRDKPNYHIYTLSSEICDSLLNPCCTEEFVFDIMKSNGNFTAPYAGNNPVVDCGEISLPILGSIVTKLGKHPRSITNYTKSNHKLHKGKVVRYVVKVGTKINVYTVGIGNNKNSLDAWLNQNTLSVKLVWGTVDRKLKNEVERVLKNKNCGSSTSTLFLFDLSGSMNSSGGNSSASKLTEAKAASKYTLNQMENNSSSVTDEVGVLGFSGGCSNDPTTLVSDFETDLVVVENKINAMRAGGGTPLAEAIAVAECKLANHLQQNNQAQGKLIILSDGVATCQKIRPSGVYNSAPLQQTTRAIAANLCGGGSATLSNPIKYYTIGFNIQPGTPAERDLQYLAQLSGGKYLNVQNQVQLERAFRKFNRTYIPKPNPALQNLSAAANTTFDKGVSQIKSAEFKTALKEWENFTKNNTQDCHGIYNLALMQEANDFYKNAIENYKKYLSLCPNPTDQVFVEKQIQFLEEAFKEFLLFQKEVLKSDLAYLKLHFEKIQNGQSIALAEEFKGFLKEKGDFYLELPSLLGKHEKLFKRNTKAVAEGLNNCAKTIRRNPHQWDRDATPFLSMTYLNLERLIKNL